MATVMQVGMPPMVVTKSRAATRLGLQLLQIRMTVLLLVMLVPRPAAQQGRERDESHWPLSRERLLFLG